MQDCPNTWLLNDGLDANGTMEDAMRTIRGVPQRPLPIKTGPIDTFAGSQVKQGHPDLTKWTPAIHQLTIWVGSSRPGCGAKARNTQWGDDQDWGAGGVQ